MTSDQRERLRIIVQQGILVRSGEMITEAVADERARNLVTIVELFFSDVKTETTLPGVGKTAETLEMRIAEMEMDADRMLKREDTR